MSYKLEWKASPNFTPASQTQAFYGQPRVIKFGAGHWWNTPEAGARHDGIVSIFLNPARQAAAHAVVSAGRVTEMVRDKDTAWCTNNANPYTYAIELDPRVMWKWTSSGANKSLGEEIFETVSEYIADKGYHNLAWYPHKKWFTTQCNPIHWTEIMARAKAIYAAKHAPVPSVSWKPVEKPRKMVAVRDTSVYELPAVKAIGDTIKKGTLVDIASKTSGGSWLRSAYSTAKNLNQGIKTVDMGEVPPPEPPKPEWIKNLVDIVDVKLMVLQPTAVIYDLNTGKAVGSPIPKGTWVDVAKQTVVAGKTYLISRYASDNAMPNGILQSDLGLPAPDPIPPTPQPEPEWLKNWQDIADVDMYTRKADVEVVNLLDGKTISKIAAMGTKVAIASSTEWMGQKYLITEYSTGKKLPNGIRLVDLDIKPVVPSDQPVPADPDKPVDDLIKENNGLLKQILALLQQIWDKLKGN